MEVVNGVVFTTVKQKIGGAQLRLGTKLEKQRCLRKDVMNMIAILRGFYWNEYGVTFDVELEQRRPMEGSTSHLPGPRSQLHRGKA